MRNTKFSPIVNELETRFLLSDLGDLAVEVPSPTKPISPGLIIPTQKPVVPPGMTNPNNGVVLPLPPQAPPLPRGDYEVPPIYNGLLT